MSNLVSNPFERRSLIIFVCCGALGVGGWVLRSPSVDYDLIEALPEQVLGEGFTTSVTCQACHPGPYDSWHGSFHRTMTQAATPSAVLGSFDDIVLEDRGMSYRLERRGDQFWVEMPDPLWLMEPSEEMPAAPPRIEARVVMTTGSHHIQNYWIRRPDGHELYLRPDDGALVQLPWVWLIEEERWVPNQDSFLTPPSPFVERPLRWNANCSKCHSVGTEPRASEDFDRFDTRSVELGIACEACHGPAAEHVRFYRSPIQRYLRYARRSRDVERSDPTIVNPAKLAQRRSVETCGQCHSFGEWTDQHQYRESGIPFRPGDRLNEYRSVFRYTESPEDPLLREILVTDSLALEGRFWPDGTIRVAGREYNGLLESPCFQVGEMTCLSCHSMHGYEEPARQLDPERTGNSSCLGCHTDLADQIAEHTRHPVQSTGSECMNCHMPRTTYGLFSAMRSHRIDNPSVQVSVNSGRPNACNLCHLDQTLEWTNRYLNEWYGQDLVELDGDERSIAASILWLMKGDAAQRTVLAWHLGWEPAQEASGETWLAPYLAQLLVDSYSATRQVAYRSMRTLPGFQGFEFDYIASRSIHEEKATEALARWVQAGAAGRTGAHLLIDEGGGIDFDEWLRLLADRDERRLRIIE